MIKLLAIPLLAFSLEPKNPNDACERFIHDHEKKACLAKTNTQYIDWYASALCESMRDDTYFFDCFKQIQKVQFEPKAMESCEELGGDNDDVKYKCLLSAKRKPASKKSIFQKPVRKK
jgi:hypothetical protein